VYKAGSPDFKSFLQQQSTASRVRYQIFKSSIFSSIIPNPISAMKLSLFGLAVLLSVGLVSAAPQPGWLQV
jgi:hypothetical protein